MDPELVLAMIATICDIAGYWPIGFIISLDQNMARVLVEQKLKYQRRTNMVPSFLNGRKALDPAQVLVVFMKSNM